MFKKLIDKFKLKLMKKETSLRLELIKTIEAWKTLRSKSKKKGKDSYRAVIIENSFYQFLTNITAKVGALLLTIILARILMPELYGLYALTLTIVGIFLTLADSGINSTLIRYTSFYLGKNKKKIAKDYASFLFKIKFILIVVFSLFLILIAFPLQNFFNKEIGFALIFSSIYLFIFALAGFFFTYFAALNKFKYSFIKEVIFQTMRVVFSGLSAFFVIKYVSKNPSIILSSIILALAFCYLLTLIFAFSIIKKKFSFLLPSLKHSIEKKKIKEIFRFILSLTLVSISSIFFGQIDTLMLGKFVQAEWLAYYRVAFSLFFGVFGLLNIGIVFYPIFSRVARKKERLNYMLRRANLLVFLVAIFGFALLEIFAYPSIILLFGKEYLATLPILRILSLLIFSSLIIPNYTFYFSAIKKPQIIAKLLFIAMLLNIFLNYFLITLLIKYGQQQAVIGAALATVFSRYVYLIGLMIMKRKNRKLR